MGGGQPANPETGDYGILISAIKAAKQDSTCERAWGRLLQMRGAWEGKTGGASVSEGWGKK